MTRDRYTDPEVNQQKLQDSQHRNFRKGVLSRDEAIGHFPENEPIWVITQHLTVKEDVEDSLNRKTVHIKTVNDLIQAIGDAPKMDGDPIASVLIFKDLPESINANLGQVKAVFDVAKTIKIYEIARDQWNDRAYQYGSLRELAAQAKGLRRSQYIYTLNADDKQKEIMESLEDDIAIEKAKVQDREKEIAELKRQLENVINENRDLQSKLTYDLGPSMKEKDKMILELRSRVSKLDTELDAETRKAYDYSIRNNELMNEQTNSKYTIEALQSKLSKEEQLSDSLRQEIENRDNDIRDSHRRMQEIIASTVDGERVAVIEKDIRKKDQRIMELENELKMVNINVRESEIDNNQLKEQIRLMRNSQKSMEIIGRTTQLDHFNLKKTDLVYIKIVDSLPYFKLAATYLFEELQERYGEQFVNMVIIKQDEGLDDQLFKGIPVVQDFTELDGTTTTYRLHPHATMFTGLDLYESEIDCLFVIDYIQNDDYLLDSLSRKEVMTMVRYPDMIKDHRLGLKGTALSLGPGSIYDLTFRPDIQRSNMRETRHNMVRRSVRQWSDNLNIRPRREERY